MPWPVHCTIRNTTHNPHQQMDRSPATTTPTTSAPSRSPPSPLATSAATRCRYKTGRCMNARVAKPNGTLLLLCELHRDQQNRTKKRSDLKYRHDRSKKRRAAVHVTKTQVLTVTAMHTPTAASERVVVASPPSLSTQLSPNGSTPTDADALKKSALYKLSSGLRSAAIGCQISPGKARLGALRCRMFDGAFSVNRRDIVAMASPHKTIASSTLPPSSFSSCSLSPTSLNQTVSPSLLPFAPLCLSPITHNSPWTSRGASPWQPEDVRILEYFIL